MRFDAAFVADRIVEGLQEARGVFPRDLERAALFGLPVSVLTVAELTTTAIENRLGRVLARLGRGVAKRRLRGCLVALGGMGYVFLDEDDPAAMRFALGHELAHFVGHYQDRRNEAVARLGEGILEVLDGAREPTWEERLGGLLAHCPLGVFGDAMVRDGSQAVDALTERMEAEADEAAFLALAPPGRVIAAAVRAEGVADRQAVEAALARDFGLTAADAVRHAPRVLAVVARSRPTLVGRLRQAAGRAGAAHRKGEEASHG
ncbi:hypothetical protein [Sphingomonas lenta]|uniref:IrrE N-terminal-like domain-containing protein n=1 Tax=Sphingomonas lenta TaxID=1141887 RepID=A0A2A2SIG2_9SPHN|nr:hypothetical protein [Sphingomonas lenta]PAX09019.1 hypothetical protein CKY28_06710 [Sphingomonas lenta]